MYLLNTGSPTGYMTEMWNRIRSYILYDPMGSYDDRNLLRSSAQLQQQAAEISCNDLFIVYRYNTKYIIKIAQLNTRF